MGGRGGKGYARRGGMNEDSPPLTLASEFPVDEPPKSPEERRPDPEPPTEQEPAGPDRDTAGGLESTIRDAYAELSTKPQDWVRLSTLREKLGNPDKAEMDAILLAMIRTGRVHLAPDSDRKTLTDADHAAAFRIGREDKHLIAIEPPDDHPGR
jgi:hypothetical protein